MKKSINNHLKNTFNCIKNTLNDMKNIFLQPVKFFKSVKKEKGIKRSLMVYIAYAVVIPIYFLYNELDVLRYIGIGALTSVMVTFIITEFLFMYGSAIVTNIFLKSLGTKNTTYKKTASVYFYTSFFRLLHFIPILNFIAVLYRGLSLIPKGLSIKYNISYNKALIGSLVPVAIFVVMTLIISSISFSLYVHLFRDLLGVYLLPDVYFSKPWPIINDLS